MEAGVVTLGRQLREVDAVPAVDTAVVPVEEIRAEDKAIRRRHLRRRLVAWLVILVLLAAVALFLYVRFVR